VDEDGCVLCLDCETHVRTRNGGVQNFLQCHHGTAQCAANKKKQQSAERAARAKENTMKWF